MVVVARSVRERERERGARVRSFTGHVVSHPGTPLCPPIPDSSKGTHSHRSHRHRLTATAATLTQTATDRAHTHTSDGATRRTPSHTRRLPRLAPGHSLARTATDRLLKLRLTPLERHMRLSTRLRPRDRLHPRSVRQPARVQLRPPALLRRPRGECQYGLCEAVHERVRRAQL